MVLIVLFFSTLVCGVFENTEVSRVISSKANGLITVETSIQCVSSGSQEMRYVYLVSPNKTIALLEAENAKKRPLAVEKRDGGFVIDLSSAKVPESGRGFSFVVTEHVVDGVSPFGSFLNLQSQEPDVLIDGHWTKRGGEVASEYAVTMVESCVLFSPYVTVSDSLEVRLQGSVLSVESPLSKHRPWRLKGNSIMFGPFRNVAPRSVESVKISSLHSSVSLITAPRVERICSRVGSSSLQCEDAWEVVNECPRPEPIRKNCSSCPGRVASLHVMLPLDASNIAMFDAIGDLTMTVSVPLARHQEIEFVPRYPLLGSYRARFVVRYTSQKEIMFAPIREVGVVRELIVNATIIFRNAVPEHVYS